MSAHSSEEILLISENILNKLFEIINNEMTKYSYDIDRLAILSTVASATFITIYSRVIEDINIIEDKRNIVKEALKLIKNELENLLNKNIN